MTVKDITKLRNKCVDLTCISVVLYFYIRFFMNDNSQIITKILYTKLD